MKLTLMILAMMMLAMSLRAGETMQARASRFLLPSLVYRDMPLSDIVDDVVAKSKKIDPEGIGVNVVLKVDDATANRKLTMSVGRPTVERILNLIASTAVLQIRYDPDAVVLEQPAAVTTDTLPTPAESEQPAK